MKKQHDDTQRQRAESLLVAAYRSGITDPKELANFMGQVQHESQNFSRLEENLNYSGSRLYDIFSNRNGLTAAKAEEIGKIPDRTERQRAVAEVAYGGPAGKAMLGNTEAGDGYTFRGRGYMQLTGRGNYTAYGKATGLDLVNHPELAADPSNAEKLAVQYWKTAVQGNTKARTDVTVAGSIINKGRAGLVPEGLPERMANAAAWESTLNQGYLEAALERHPQAQVTAASDPLNQPLQLKPTHQLSPQSLQLIQDSEHHVRLLAERHHLPWDQGMNNTVFAIAQHAREQGMTNITHLKVADGQIWLAQQAKGEPLREGQIDATAAANAGVDQSADRMVQADQAPARSATPVVEERSHARESALAH